MGGDEGADDEDGTRGTVGKSGWPSIAGKAVPALHDTSGMGFRTIGAASGYGMLVGRVFVGEGLVDREAMLVGKGEFEVKGAETDKSSSTAQKQQSSARPSPRNMD